METMEIMGIAAIPVIAVICLLIGQAVKFSPIPNEWIPIICGACGGILGVVAMFTMSGYPASDPLTAIAYGIVSGFAATGLHQAFVKQPERARNEEAAKDGN